MISRIKTFHDHGSKIKVMAGGELHIKMAVTPSMLEYRYETRTGVSAITLEEVMFLWYLSFGFTFGFKNHTGPHLVAILVISKVQR